MNYHNITTADMMNGEGLRVVLWLSGCSHHCYNCQNPQTWDANSGIPFDDVAKEELFRELDKDYISGLTLTGGDPLHESNLDDVFDLVNEFRLSRPQKTIWLYTGYTWEEIAKNSMDEQLEYGQWTKRANIVAQCDVIVDGRYIESKRDITRKWCGSSNQNVINMQKTLEKGKVILWDS